MEVLDIHLERPTNFPPTIAMVMVFLMVKVLKYLRVMKDVDICLLRQEILLITFLEFIIVVMVVEVDIRLKRPATLPISIVEFIIVVIKVVIMVDVEIGINIPYTLPLEILDQEFMLAGEVDKGLRQATNPPITQA